MNDNSGPTVGARHTPIEDPAALDNVIERSHHEPVLLFKHDPWCGISNSAWEEVLEAEVPVAVIDVARNHHLGQLAAARTGVRHQSPQIILIRAGRPLWSASHFSITAPAVTRALQEHADQPGQ